MAGFEKGIAINLNSMMARALKFQEMLARSQGSLI